MSEPTLNRKNPRSEQGGGSLGKHALLTLCRINSPTSSWLRGGALALHHICRRRCLWSKTISCGEICLHMTSDFAPHDKVVCPVEQFCHVEHWHLKWWAMCHFSTWQFLMHMTNLQWMLSFYVFPCFDAISDSCTFQWSKNLPKNLVCGAKITKIMYGSCLFVVTRHARWKEYFYQLSFALISAPASVFFKLVQILTLRRFLK